MKLLLVSAVDAWTRSVSTVHRYVAAGRALGHEVFVYGEPNPDLPALPYSTELRGADAALFVVQVPTDFPDMPYLARILDELPRERRLVVDLWGRCNDTVRVEHDFNHLEKLDGHLGWEWREAIQAVSDTVLQPTLTPGVHSFLFHAYDPDAITAPAKSAREAADAWRKKPYGMMYVGSNWQRWEQVRRFLEGFAAVRDRVGPACLVGWDWGQRPDWAVQKGIVGIDTDPRFLAAAGVEIRHGVRFDEVVPLLDQARFTPVFHRPLFRHFGYVTNRTFETFYADTLPVLMLPREFVSSIYGPAALMLVPGDDLAAHLTDAMDRPEAYWDAVLQTRMHLGRHQSYARRFEQLQALVGAGALR